MTVDLHERDIVVTGASGGLGGAVVETLLAAGARCHVPVMETAEALAGRPWASHPRVRLAPGVHLEREDEVARFYQALPLGDGGLWASIHLVGGFAMAPLLETSLGDFAAQWQLNAVTSFLCTREAARSMLQRDGRGTSVGGAGRIVNVISKTVAQPAGSMVAYTAAKAAVAALTQTAAAEWRAHGLWVNAVAPSIIDTPANRAAMPGAAFDAWAKPAEIAATIAFLASPQNAVTTGALLPVGGRTA